MAPWDLISKTQTVKNPSGQTIPLPQQLNYNKKEGKNEKEGEPLGSKRLMIYINYCNMDLICIWMGQTIENLNNETIKEG